VTWYDKKKIGGLMITQAVNTIKRKMHYVWRLSIVTKSCESHIDDIAVRSNLDLCDPQIQRLVDQCEMLPLEKRGPFLAYVLVLMEKGHDLQAARVISYDWAASSH
tara:strand:- start:591 stop:908 length:318 start_codon:yes stop_codon:yes gene_type:complete